MSGSREQGLKAKATMLNKDPAYFSKLGKLGGSVKTKKGFALISKERLAEVSALGGHRGLGRTKKRDRENL